MRFVNRQRRRLTATKKKTRVEESSFWNSRKSWTRRRSPEEEQEADTEADPEGGADDVVQDGNDMCVQSVVSVVIPRKSVSDGGIKIEAVRFQRFAKDKNEELTTRFPKKEVGDRLAHHKYAQTDNQTLTTAEHKTKHEEAAAKNRKIADHQLVTFGFRLEGLCSPMKPCIRSCQCTRNAQPQRLSGIFSWAANPY